MTVKKSLKKIHLRGSHDVFLMSEHEIEGGLRLQILNVELKEAYFGQVSDFDLRVQAANIRLTHSDFIQKAIDALFEKNIESYLFTLEKQNGNFIFKWKSIDHEETIINLGYVEMQKNDSAVIFTEILQSISEEMHSLNSKVEAMSAELEETKKDASEALKQLSLVIDAKESMEKELYSKFVLVLNAKKRRIRELQQQSSTNKEPKSKKTKTTHILSSDSSDVDGELDLHQPGPSNFTGRNSLPFLDDNELVVPVTQKRVRNKKCQITTKPRKVEAEKSSWINAPAVEQDDDSDDLLKCL